jgi:hypothetical protein
MSFERFSIIRPIAGCALALALSGCVAAPLAQMAVMQMAPKPPCTAPSDCQAATTNGSFADLSHGLSDSFHKLTGQTSDPQPEPAPAK